MRIRVVVSLDEQYAGILAAGVAALERIATAAEAIARNTVPAPPPATAVSFLLLLGGLDVKKGQIFGGKRGKTAAGGPVSITDDPAGQLIAVVGVDKQGVLGAPLAAGAKIAISVGAGASGKTAATFTADASPRAVNFTDANGNPQTNVPSLISGILAAQQSPVDPNDPFTVSYAITNPDGTPGDTGSGSAQIVPGTEASEVLVLQAS